jgi:hypothetical protein
MSGRFIIIRAKEREIKIAPRLFAMTTLEMRRHFCVTGANIALFMFRYFPQQTMTLDEADLSERLFTLTGNLDVTYHVLSASLGIDFSTWNISWTFLSTRHISSSLLMIFLEHLVYTLETIYFLRNQ